MERYLDVPFKCFKSLCTFSFYSHFENILCNTVIKSGHNSEKKILNPSCFVVVFEISLRIHQNNLYRLIDLISRCSSTECCHLTSTLISSHISFILATFSLSISFFFSSVIAKDFISFSKKSDLVSQHCF